jgi:hypothetical protein
MILKWLQMMHHHREKANQLIHLRKVASVIGR